MPSPLVNPQSSALLLVLQLMAVFGTPNLSARVNIRVGLLSVYLGPRYVVWSLSTPLYICVWDAGSILLERLKVNNLINVFECISIGMYDMR